MTKGSISHDHKVLRDLLNRCFIRSAGGADRPRIMSAATMFPQAKLLEDDFEQIQKEIMTLVNTRGLARYEDIDEYRAREVSLDWRLYYVKMLGDLNQEAIKHCPTVIRHLDPVKSVYNITISVLDAGVDLAAHKGPYAGILRYHLALKVPKNNPPHIRVDNITYVWKEGESVVIDDSFEHEVVNQSDDIRVVLLVDILRPMNPILEFLNRFLLRLKKKWSAHFIKRTNNA